jgi:hypothetical protein
MGGALGGGGAVFVNLSRNDIISYPYFLTLLRHAA